MMIEIRMNIALGKYFILLRIIGEKENEGIFINPEPRALKLPLSLFRDPIYGPEEDLVSEGKISKAQLQLYRQCLEEEDSSEIDRVIEDFEELAPAEQESLLQRLSDRHKKQKLKGATPPVKSVLVVEDDDTLRDVIVGIIKDEYPDFHIETAADGMEALDRISRQTPSILITNVMMPKMTGIELLTALHRKGIVLPTIVTSGYYKYEAFEKWLSDEQIPCREKFLFLEKPFPFEQVKTWIDGILKGNT